MTNRWGVAGDAARDRRRCVLAALAVLAIAAGVTSSASVPRSASPATPRQSAPFAELPFGTTPLGKQGRGSATAGAPMAFGVLGSTCDRHRTAALRDAGVRFAEMGVDWSAFEPRQGSFDHGYQVEVARKLERCRQAGLDVVLSLGLNSAPRWASTLNAGSYENQDGDRGPDHVPNLVFSAAVRGAVSDYLAELDRVVGLDSSTAIRVGTGINGELGYPDVDTDTTNAYWAFDVAAQDGTGLAHGMSVSPMPGWTPGSATWRGAKVSTADVQTWFRWYSGSVADSVVWVVRQLRGLGYTHDIHLPLAGRGELPADLRRALAAHLDGTDERDGSLPAGLYYPDQLHQIARALARTERPGWGTVSADATSLDDSTAVSARQLDPPQDGCRPGDLLTNPHVAKWSSFRWTVATARAVGLGVVGENPGPPGAPGTGANDQTDSSERQMDYAPRYAQECGMTLFQWAFEEELFWDGRAGLRAYAERQRALANGRSVPPSRSGDVTGDGP